jgi:cation diffusion facilitator family transporter
MLLFHFVRMLENKNKQAYYGYLEGWISIVINVCLFVIKYWAGIVSGSVAIIADAWHTLSDSLTSIIVIIGIKISKKPADKEHPFGHERAELIGSLIIGVLLFIIAFEFVVESVKKLLNHQTVEYGLIAIVVTIISILVKEALAQFAFWAAKKVNSNALKADAWHHRSDSISSLLILIGIFLQDYFWWVDGILGILVAILIAGAAYKIIKTAVNPLLGENYDDKLEQTINQISEKLGNDNLNIHHIHLHRYGSHTETDVSYLFARRHFAW